MLKSSKEKKLGHFVLWRNLSHQAVLKREPKGGKGWFDFQLSKTFFHFKPFKWFALIFHKIYTNYLDLIS